MRKPNPNSIESEKPWIAEDISRAQWYARQRRLKEREALENALERPVTTHEMRIHREIKQASQRLSVPEPALFALYEQYNGPINNPW